MHRNAMQLAAIAMSSPIVTDTLPPVGLEQVLRPSRRHSLEMHPQDIELVIDTEAHIGLRDDLPDPFVLAEVLAYFDAEGITYPLENWLEAVRCIRGRIYADDPRDSNWQEEIARFREACGRIEKARAVARRIEQAS